MDQRGPAAREILRRLRRRRAADHFGDRRAEGEREEEDLGAPLRLQRRRVAKRRAHLHGRAGDAKGRDLRGRLRGVDDEAEALQPVERRDEVAHRVGLRGIDRAGVEDRRGPGPRRAGALGIAKGRVGGRVADHEGGAQPRVAGGEILRHRLVGRDHGRGARRPAPLAPAREGAVAGAGVRRPLEHRVVEQPGDQRPARPARGERGGGQVEWRAAAADEARRTGGGAQRGARAGDDERGEPSAAVEVGQRPGAQPCRQQRPTRQRQGRRGLRPARRVLGQPHRPRRGGRVAQQLREHARLPAVGGRDGGAEHGNLRRRRGHPSPSAGATRSIRIASIGTATRTSLVAGETTSKASASSTQCSCTALATVPAAADAVRK